MRLVFISDTHNKLSRISVPDGDVLVHCGDFCGRGIEHEVEVFNSELTALPHKHKVLIAGNHDWLFQRQNKLARSLLDAGITYLQDSSAEVAGLRFYGSPWQPEFFNWAFNLPRQSAELKARWDAIAEDVDVLVTHGPPFGILDRTPGGMRVGCEFLLERVAQLKPRIHCFGHIHDAYGTEAREGTLFINAANLNEAYQPANKPVVVDIDGDRVALVEEINLTSEHL